MIWFVDQSWFTFIFENFFSTELHFTSLCNAAKCSAEIYFCIRRWYIKLWAFPSRQSCHLHYLAQGWPTGQPVRDQEPHYLLCYRKEPHYARGHTWTSTHLFNSRNTVTNTCVVSMLWRVMCSHNPPSTLTRNTCLSSISCVSRTPASKVNNWCKILRLRQYTNKYGIYVSAAWNQAKSGMRSASHGLVRPDLAHLAATPGLKNLLHIRGQMNSRIPLAEGKRFNFILNVCLHPLRKTRKWNYQERERLIFGFWQVSAYHGVSFRWDVLNYIG